MGFIDQPDLLTRVNNSKVSLASFVVKACLEELKGSVSNGLSDTENSFTQTASEFTIAIEFFAYSSPRIPREQSFQERSSFLVLIVLIIIIYLQELVFIK